MPIALVAWEDSRSLGGWHTPDQWREQLAEGLIECRSVGYVLHQDETRLVLAQSQGRSGEVADCLDIPRSAVRSVRVLEEATTPCP
jgi:hypothetical protein